MSKAYVCADAGIENPGFLIETYANSLSLRLNRWRECDKIVIKNDEEMEQKELLDIIRTLHKGDRIHVEYKTPFSKKIISGDTEYLGMLCDVMGYGEWRFVTLFVRGNDLDTFKDNILVGLFKYLKLVLKDSDRVSEWHLKLEKIQDIKKIG